MKHLLPAQAVDDRNSAGVHQVCHLAPDERSTHDTATALFNDPLSPAVRAFSMEECAGTLHFGTDLTHFEALLLGLVC